MKAAQSGFTLIELMTVSAILGVLSVYALGAYSGYTTRAKLAEVLAISHPAKLGISEACIAEGVMPATPAKAGIILDSEVSQYVSLVEYNIDATDPTLARLTYTIENIDSTLDGKWIDLVGTCSSSSVNWDCLGDAGVDRFLPKSC